MRSRVLIGAAAVLTVLAATIAATSRMPARQSAVVQFARPTIIAGTIITGKVVFVHDDNKMMNGEPCTTVYRYEQGREGTKIVEFMCKPTRTARVENFTARCARTGATGPDVLSEYQFGGDTESHGVPWRP